MNTGAFGEGFPYSNFHDLNMDWIIKIAKDFLDQYSTIQETMEEGMTQLNERYEEIDTLLNEWYDSHSEDIAEQLADALQDLTDWYNLHEDYLDQTLATNTATFNSRAEAKGQQVIDSIPDDYTALSNNVVTLDTAVKQMLVENEVNMVYEQGGINTSNGAPLVSNPEKYIRTTGYTKFPYGIKLIIPDTLTVKIFEYSEDNYESYITHGTVTGTYYLINNENYYRFQISYPDLSDITTAVSSDVSHFYLYPTDTSLTLPYKSADADVVGRLLTQKEKIDIIWAQGSINSSTGGAQANITNRCRSKRYVFFKKYLKVTPPEGYKMYWYRYATLEYTSYTGSSGAWLTDPFTIIDDGAYYKLTISKLDNSTLTPADLADVTFDIEVGMPYNTAFKDITDPTSVLESMLATYKHVNIDEGVYTITRTITDFREGSELVGSGLCTILKFDSEATGAMFKLASNCVVKDMQIEGRETDYTLDNDDPNSVVPSTMGNRHGIEITGEIARGTIDNVYIHGFSGFCIYCHDNGIHSNQGFNIINCFLCNSHGGLYLKQAEFFRITNCDMNQNYVGMYNGGGNNNISCCNISSNYIGISFDNEDETAINNTHGSVTGCSIQHSRTYAIYFNNVAAGEVFNGCNIDGNITVINSYRIVFSCCNFMADFYVVVTNGGLLMFNACNMRSYAESNSVITNNARVKFINCYQSNGTPVDPTD